MTNVTLSIVATICNYNHWKIPVFQVLTIHDRFQNPAATYKADDRTPQISSG
ncbi:hypothetical protein [Altericista sp. CCNU0014]|uniref:hypothetical protein n=1 Tax=Altericista sp. CCNU0014 TaxID=3082949 RepID=UPI0038505B54